VTLPPPRCPVCKAFAAIGRKEAWALTHDGKRVTVYLSVLACNRCGHRRTEDYEQAVNRLRLLPYTEEA
jgi:C4-type Zn-finger protein